MRPCDRDGLCAAANRGRRQRSTLPGAAGSRRTLEARGIHGRAGALGIELRAAPDQRLAQYVLQHGQGRDRGVRDAGGKPQAAGLLSRHVSSARGDFQSRDPSEGRGHQHGVSGQPRPEPGRSAAANFDPAGRFGVRGRGVRKLALPAILGYLAVGMLLGPHALALAVDNETTRLLADFGVVFLVFTLGLEFSLPRLVAMRWEVLGVGGAQVSDDGGSSRPPIGCFDIAPPSRGDRRRGGHVIDGHHHRAAHRTVGEQPHARPARGGDLPVSGPELSAVPRLGVRARGGGGGRAAHIAIAIGIAGLALLLVLAAGRWLLRPLFLPSPRCARRSCSRSPCCSRCWPRRGRPRRGLSLALGAFLAGMMLAETEFRHQIEATIRSYREVLLGLFFITVGMLLDVRLLLRTLAAGHGDPRRHAGAQAAVVTVVAEPATKSWFKSLRTGVVVAGRGIRLRAADAAAAARAARSGRRAAAARRHGAVHGAVAAADRTTGASRARCCASPGRPTPKRCARPRPRWPSPSAITS
jgi:hypothetical protein